MMHHVLKNEVMWWYYYVNGVNVPMTDIMTKCMISMSICESNISWYVYVLQKMLGEPNPCGIEISKGIWK